MRKDNFIPTTWRRDSYAALAKVNESFESIVDALGVLRGYRILEDATMGNMWEELENIWWGFNFICLTEFHAREKNNGAYGVMQDEIQKRLKKLKP